KTKTMKKYLKNSTKILVCILIVSCSNYLDIQPEDKYIEKDVFSSEKAINTALNGIYLHMASNNTYGGNLTMSTLDVLAQRYKVDTSSDWYYTATYDYKNNDVKIIFNSIWTNLYRNILNINNFLQGLETYKGVVSPEKENILKGEAIALRAMLHLDLLRIYGPIYSTNADALAIPYNTKATTELSPILPAREVMTKILNDLSVAEKLLKNDGVRKLASSPFTLASNGYAYYRDDRNLRVNYFAVKALQARANLYAGNKAAALAAAKTVIDEASPFFPWTKPSAFISTGKNPDRIFFTEVLFAIQNKNLYKQHIALFSYDLNDKEILAPQKSRLNDVFENNQSDFRLNLLWAIPTDGEKKYKTFLKFADIEAKSLSFRFKQPLIRMSEMYYIAAETAQDPTLALRYLNTARDNRGLGGLTTSVDLKSEILKEYEREFYGEGQLFFYYKRNNFTSIPNGSLASGSIDMGPDQYVVPLPLSETAFH
ncbi:MAG: RagB/SusD family nutrient uptake outer membrane protein, partial [Polaribacter sp.]